MGGNKQVFNKNGNFRPKRGCGRGQHASKELPSSFREVMWNFDKNFRSVVKKASKIYDMPKIARYFMEAKVVNDKIARVHIK